MKCPKCNREVFEGQNYCSNCGASLKQEEKTGQNEEGLNSWKKHKLKMQQAAMTVANLYLEKFPREICYGVECYYYGPEKTETFYRALTDMQIAVLKECTIKAEAEGCDLEQILENEGHHGLIKYLKPRDNSTLEYKIKSLDFNDIHKYTIFYCQEIETDHKIGPTHNYRIALTDEEYKEILAELLLNGNYYSMNMLVYEKPEICQRIMKNLTKASTKYPRWFNYNAFAVDMIELKSVCETILNPIKDVIGAFKSDDRYIRELVISNQISPGIRDKEIFSYGDDDFCGHIYMHIQGKHVRITQTESWCYGGFGNEAAFIVDTAEIMEVLSLNSPEEIFPYLKEHFANENIMQQLKESFKSVKILY